MSGDQDNGENRKKKASGPEAADENLAKEKEEREKEKEEREEAEDEEEAKKDEEESAEDSEDLRRQYLLQRFWQSARGFWSGRGRTVAWILTGTLLLIVLLNIATSYGMNLWNRAIFDALQNKDAHAVFLLSMVYFALLAASVGVNVAQVYGRMTIQRRWRKWYADNPRWRHHSRQEWKDHQRQ